MLTEGKNTWRHPGEEPMVSKPEHNLERPAYTRGRLAQVKSHLKLVAVYFRFNLAAAMEYRGSFLLQVFGMAINNASFVVFWRIVYSQVETIGGYGFREVMFIWALASSSFGFAHILFGNLGRLTEMILQGELDAYLLQPKDVYLNALSSKTIVSAWGDFFYGIILFLLAQGFEPGRFLLFGVFVVFSGLLMGSVFFTAETLTFFLGNASALGRLVQEFLISFTLYPEGIFKGAIHWLIYSLIPAGFIVFLPLRIFTAFSWRWLGWLMVIDLGYIVFGYILFRRGLKRYESGNLIVTKL